MSISRKSLCDSASYLIASSSAVGGGLLLSFLGDFDDSRDFVIISFS